MPMETVVFGICDRALIREGLGEHRSLARRES
jgi:hypothetical protein